MLTGLRILNTRPPCEPSGRSNPQTLQSLGATVIDLPLFRIAPLPFTFPNLTLFHTAIFVSQHAVPSFFSHPAYTGWPKACTPIAIGEATADALRAYQLEPILPQAAHSESLLDLEILAAPQKKPILLVKGKNGRTLIQDTLRERGAMVTPCDVYKREPIAYPPDTIQTIWQEDKIDIILLTSFEAMEALLALFGEAGAPWVKKKPCLVISERLQKLAQEKGFQRILVTTPDRIIEGLSSFAMTEIT